MYVILLALALFACLLLVPFGLPGTWLMLGVAAAYGMATGEPSIGVSTLVGLGLLATVAEIAEFTLAGRYTRKYGGSRRASWGAIIGGTIGAFAGIPIPVLGSLIGAFAGSFVGALVFEMSRGTRADASMRVATGALVGRAVAVALKVATGLIMAIWIIAVVLYETSRA
jgi:uncharacterized protein YqgC (DUF456 family)